jgi:hypothetical protein
MKYLIAESRIKNLIKKYFNLDLTNNISMVTNKCELPMEFDGFMNDRLLNRYLNAYGPMYVIKTHKDMYLGQPRETGKGWHFFNTNDNKVSNHQIMRELGIHPLNLSVDDLINAYIND